MKWNKVVVADKERVTEGVVVTYSARFNYLNLSNQISLNFENFFKVILSKQTKLCVARDVTHLEPSRKTGEFDGLRPVHRLVYRISRQYRSGENIKNP